MTTYLINSKDIDQDAVARGLAAKAHIAALQAKAEEEHAHIPTVSLLTNVNDRLDTLAGLAPQREFFASNGLVTSLGYYITNALLWDFRMANKADVEDDTSIDDDMAKYDIKPRTVVAHDTGRTELPRLNAVPLLGVFKQLYYMQRGSAYAPEFPPRSLKAIAIEMISNGKVEDVRKAYASMADTEISASKSAAAIKQRMAANAKANQVFSDRNKAELAHVVDSFTAIAPEQFTDDHWKQIPLWVQYKFIVNIYNAITKEIAIDMAINPIGGATRSDLIALADEILLELQAACRTSEVKLAFAEGRLDHRHVLETSEPDIPAELLV